MTANKHNKIFSDSTLILFFYGASQLIRLASNLLLTRLLTPDLFGLMAILNLFIHGFVLFSDLGLNLSIIQSKNGNKKEFQNTVWTLQFLRGIVFFFVALMLAPFLAELYENEVLIPTFIALGFSLFLSGAVPLKLTLLERNLQFIKPQVIALAIQIAVTLFVISLAFFYSSIWVLVIGQILSSALLLIFVTFFVAGENQRFRLNKTYLFEIFRFGKWILLSSLLSFLNKQLPTFYLSLKLSLTNFGIYTIALFIAEAAIGIFSKIISKVMIPHFSSQIRDSEINAIKLFNFIYIRLAFICGFASATLYFASESIISVLYDARYEQAGSILRYLALLLLFNPLANLGLNFLLSQGKSKYSAHLLAFQIFLMLIILPLSYTHAGIDGFLLALVLCKSFGYPYFLFISYKNNLWSTKREIFCVLSLSSGLLTSFIVCTLLLNIF